MYLAIIGGIPYLAEKAEYIHAVVRFTGRQPRTTQLTDKVTISGGYIRAVISASGVTGGKIALYFPKDRVVRVEIPKIEGG